MLLPDIGIRTIVSACMMQKRSKGFVKSMLAGTIAGCDGPSDIARFAETQLAWCRKFVPLKNGVPSHDTIGRVISLIKPDQFQNMIALAN